jgi:hypothetical protein
MEEGWCRGEVGQQGLEWRETIAAVMRRCAYKGARARGGSWSAAPSPVAGKVRHRASRGESEGLPGGALEGGWGGRNWASEGSGVLVSGLSLDGGGGVVNRIGRGGTRDLASGVALAGGGR